jgi:16S rRNA (cytosine1402-N4)-methyltransferase
MTGERNGMEHQPVLLDEAIAALDIQAEGVYVDGTFGRGGHSRAVLNRLGPEGRLLAFDRDPEAVMAAQVLAADPRFASRFSIVHAPFSSLGAVLQEHAPGGVDGVLLDLGVSSPQLDQGERGFSFRHDGPLDMRMDPTCGQSAAEFVAHAEEQEIARVLKEFGEERFAKRIARAIVLARSQQAILTTRQLALIVAGAVPKREPGTDPATRTFQALRIYVNAELTEVASVLPQALKALRQGGRLAVISFHSLEDRCVKQFISAHSKPPEIPAGLAIREVDRPVPSLKTIGKAIFAGEEELKRNPRARSAVLRVAERTGAALI